jgi:endonuclease/exonuclease/phosphatase family metal-dependent hydrolase
MRTRPEQGSDMTVTCIRAVKKMTRSYLTGPGLLVVILLLQSCASAEFRTTPVVQSLQEKAAVNSVSRVSGDEVLKIMTLNIAHGRGEGFHQLLQNGAEAQSNLDAIATLLKQQHPDIAALQEADGPSYWSGKIDHVEYLAMQGDFSQYVRANHVDGYGLFYGTAFVSNLEMKHPEAITFEPELSMAPKGFIVATVTWPGEPCVELDVVSVHLDFSSEAIRRRQAAELVDILRTRNRPMVVMGDFNTRWDKENSALHLIVRELGLSPYKPEQAGLETFARFGHRLDWVLVSPGFRFHSYDVINDHVSDHRAVVAELALNREVHAARASDSCSARLDE